MSNMSKKREAVILSAVRTPTGRFLGAISGIKATDLGGIAVRAAVERSGIDPSTVYEVLMGNVVSAGVGQAPARQAALRGGLPDSVGATTINKVCGSGLKAVIIAANAIAAGEANVFVAGGMENMSQAPYLVPKVRQGLKFGNGQLSDSLLTDGLWCSFQDWVMGNGAEFIAKQYELTREELDQYAVNSHDKAAAATANGLFMEEIVPVEVRGRKGKVTIFDKDESVRATYADGDYALTTSLEQLGKLPPAFEKDGIITAGNAPGLNDAGAALVVTSRNEAERQGSEPVARIIGYTLAAVDPQWIFISPARAIPRLLDQVGWSMADVDLIELNEAFAAQVLADGIEIANQGLDWNWDKVNVNGGAVALGHPIGASGARVLVTLIHALKQRKLKRGIASLCLGGGEAVAMAIEVE
jgi:acetyl-CoA C-acetyltransferase